MPSDRRIINDEGTFGAMLRELRELRGMGWDEIGARMGVHPSDVKKYCAPESLPYKRPLSLRYALRLATIFGARIVVEW